MKQQATPGLFESPAVAVNGDFSPGPWCLATLDSGPHKSEICGRPGKYKLKHLTVCGLHRPRNGAVELAVSLGQFPTRSTIKVHKGNPIDQANLELKQIADWRAGVPGIYPGLDMREYHAAPYDSNSFFKDFAVCPAMGKHSREAEKKETDAMRFGRVLHTSVLEPDRFDLEVQVADDCEAIVGSGPRKGLPCGNGGKHRVEGVWVCGRHLPKGTAEDNIRQIVITQSEYDRLKAASAAVLADPWASVLLGGDAQNELSLLWENPTTGRLTKARIDHPSILNVEGKDLKVIVDIKKMADVSPRGVEKAIATFDYYRQGGMYIDGARILGYGEFDWFVLVCVMDEAPFLVETYAIIDDHLRIGSNEANLLSVQVAECENSGKWPKHTDGIKSISLPPWKLYDLENKYGEGLV